MSLRRRAGHGRLRSVFHLWGRDSSSSEATSSQAGATASEPDQDIPLPLTNCHANSHADEDIDAIGRYIVNREELQELICDATTAQGQSRTTAVPFAGTVQLLTPPLYKSVYTFDPSVVGQHISLQTQNCFHPSRALQVEQSTFLRVPLRRNRLCVLTLQDIPGDRPRFDFELVTPLTGPHTTEITMMMGASINITAAIRLIAERELDRIHAIYHPNGLSAHSGPSNTDSSEEARPYGEEDNPAWTPDPANAPLTLSQMFIAHHNISPASLLALQTLIGSIKAHHTSAFTLAGHPFPTRALRSYRFPSASAHSTPPIWLPQLLTPATRTYALMHTTAPLRSVRADHPPLSHTPNTTLQLLGQHLSEKVECRVEGIKFCTGNCWSTSRTMHALTGGPGGPARAVRCVPLFDMHRNRFGMVSRVVRLWICFLEPYPYDTSSASGNM